MSNPPDGPEPLNINEGWVLENITLALLTVVLFVVFGYKPWNGTGKYS